MGIAIALHTLAAVIWVGGMFFAYMAMRPAVVEVVEPSQRGLLWHRTLNRFFLWVWVSIAVLLLTGYWMVFSVFGGMAGAGWHVHLMQGVGIVMMLVFLHVYFAPFRRLRLAIADSNPEEAGRRVGQIRKLVAFNLVLGVIVVLVGSGGRFF